MKHNLKVTFLLVFLFLAAQYIGLAIINNSETLPYSFERPVFSQQYGYLQLFGYILAATAIALLITIFGFALLWRIVFFISTLICLTLAFSAFIPDNPALILAILFSFAQIFRISIILHNFTELFIYGGLAALFVPSLSLYSATILLILISVYDAIAVWKTKHMIKLAKFQSKAKTFAGLVIPYKKRTAILGGGDIGFPLIFIGSVYNSIGISALIIPIFAALALLILLWQGEKNKFYPAMPFITAGCFIGYLISLAL